ncbi:MAG: O-antigen ligase family protein [Deltaproteobacteria bacterium]|nr:O-antigen ligase family protein [Deltaproteobacteria bacterium]
MTTLPLVAPPRAAHGPAEVSWGYFALVGTLVVLGVVINAATGGNVLLAVLPALVIAGAWALWRLPMRHTLLVLLLVALVVDNPSERPQQGRWQSLLYDPGTLLYLNLHVTTGVSALRFSLLEVLLAFLAAVAAARAVRGTTEDGPAGAAGARPLGQALVTYSAALAVFAAWGLVRGGSGVQILWQVRQLGWLPVLVFLAMRAFRSRADVWRLSAAMILAALIRGGVGIYYYFAICRPQGYTPDFVTTHGDSMLFGIAFIIPLICLLERPGASSVWLSLLVLPPVGLALVLNNRRLAFVSLLVALVALAFSLRRSVRLALARALIVGAPLLLGYIVLGWNSASAFFAPIARIKSAADPGNTSNQTRDIENTNLIVTYLQNPLVGSGFGHEYIEGVRAFDISTLFAQYRYIAHNSVLWLWSQAGIVGFLLFWAPFLVGVFLATRTYRCAESGTQRVAAMTTLAALVCYFGQAYGDMGLQSWTGTLVLSAWLGVTGHLAVVTSAWPEGEGVLRWPTHAAG